MATVIDLLRHLGQHAAPTGDNALAGHVVLPGVSDSALALPLAPALVAAWTETTSRTTQGHHALALSSAQAGNSVALMGHGSAPHADLILLSLSQLRFEHTTLWIVPDEAAALRSTLTSLADRLKLRWIDAAKPGPRVTEAHLVLATPRDLHGRLLRFHDRAWRWLWSRLRIVALPELHHLGAVRAGHLRWLLRRVERLTDGAPQILASVAPIMDADGTLSRLAGRPVHVIAAPSGPAHSTQIALWRAGSERGAATLHLARQLVARQLDITLCGRTDAETEQLRAALVATAGAKLTPDARAAIVAGVPVAANERNALLRAGYRLAVLIAGDEPHELLFAHQPELLLQTLPRWPLAVGNPHIAAAHLACAAAELPLAEAEIDAWQMRELRDRMVKKGTLLALPGSDQWHSAPSADDPYAGLELASLGPAPSKVFDPAGNLVGEIAVALLDRTALPGQVYAPGLRVASRDDVAHTVQLAFDSTPRETVVLADVGVKVREELAARTVRFNKVVADLVRGKVLVTQQVRGLREYRVDGSAERPLRSTIDSQWSAAACWIGMGGPPPNTPLLGWAIQTVAPLVMLTPPAALAVSYAAEQQRLYFIEVEPGGVGVIDCVYEAFERLVELAFQLTLACAHSPLYRNLAASERIWLDALRGIPTSAPAAETPHPVRATAKLDRIAAASAATAVTATMPITRAPAESTPAGPIRVAAEYRPASASLRGTAPRPQQVEREAVDAVVHHTPSQERKTQLAESGSVTPEIMHRSGPGASSVVPPIPAAAAHAATATLEAAAVARREPPMERSVAEQWGLHDEASLAHAATSFSPADPQPIESEAGTAPQLEPEGSSAKVNRDEPQPLNQPTGVAEQPALTPQRALYAKPERQADVAPSHGTLAAPGELPAEQPEAEGAKRSKERGTLETVAAAEQRTLPAAQPDQAPKLLETQSADAPSSREPQAPMEVAEWRRDPSQFRLIDLLPPLDEELDDPAQDHEAGNKHSLSEEALSTARITRLPAPVRGPRADVNRRSAPRPPLPFRRPQTASTGGTGQSNEPPAADSSRALPKPAAEQPRREPGTPPAARRPANDTRSPDGAAKALREVQRQQEPPQPPRDAPHREQPPGKPPQRATPAPPDRAAREATRRDPSRPPASNAAGERQPPGARALQGAGRTSQPPAGAPSPANVNDMIARMRQLREQREAEQARRQAPVPEPRARASLEGLRFRIGERVQCLPYGIGVVRASKLEEDRELVTIDFREYGEIEVDSAVSLVRKLAQAPKASDEWADESDDGR